MAWIAQIAKTVFECDLVRSEFHAISQSSSVLLHAMLGIALTVE